MDVASLYYLPFNMAELSLGFTKILLSVPGTVHVIKSHMVLPGTHHLVQLHPCVF